MVDPAIPGNTVCMYQSKAGKTKGPKVSIEVWDLVQTLWLACCVLTKGEDSFGDYFDPA